MNNKLICQICKKEFSSTSSKNRHVRDFHPEVKQPTRKKRIMCPLCPDEQVFSFHINLLKHLTDNHQVQINESVLYFRNLEEFTVWKALENREVDYACDVKKKIPNGDKEILYNCNRSDSRGFVSLCTKRSMKTGGSIRMRGMCPSRIKVKISKDGKVMVKFTETHVGHDDELRSKRLTKDEQNIIVGQLTAGVTNNKILQDAKKTENAQLNRINVITRGKVAYLIRKNNIDNKRHADDTIEMKKIKIEECINESATSELYHQNDVTHLIQQNSRTQDQETSPSFNAGVTNNKILQDARNTENAQLKRINVITRGEVADLIRKNNIDNKRHADDTIEMRKIKIEECINESETSELYHQNDITQLIQENSRTQDQETSPSFNETREIGIAMMNNFSRTLDKREFENLMAVYTKFQNDIIETREQDRISKKRKIQKPTHYPNKK